MKFVSFKIGIGIILRERIAAMQLKKTNILDVCINVIIFNEKATKTTS